MTADTEDDKPHTATILELFGLRPRCHPHRRHGIVEPAQYRHIDTDALGTSTPIRPHHWSDRPMPLSAEELPHYRSVPIDGRGAPHYRSQLAAMEAEIAASHAGRMRCFSFDDDINALHFIARFERAGLGHRADRYRDELAGHRRREAAHGQPFPTMQPDRDYDSEALLSKMYGTPDEDRARLERFLCRRAELEVAQRRGLPARYSTYELV